MINVNLFLYLAPPKVHAINSNIVGLFGKNVTVSFEVTEAAPLVVRSDVSWLFTPSGGETRNLQIVSRFTYSTNGLNLTISGLLFGDEGVYRVTTKNRNGQDSASLTLVVDGK